MSMLPARATRRSAPPVIPLILAAACWGSGTVLSKEAIGVAPPILLLPAQLASSLALLAAVAWIRREPVQLVTRPRRVGALGLLNPGLAYSLALVGLTQVSASVAVIVWATEPAMVALLAAAVLRERLPRPVAALSVVAVLGTVFLAGETGSATTAIGVAVLATAVGLCAIYTVATRSWMAGDSETLGIVTAQQAAGLCLALVAAGVAVGAVGPTALVVTGRPSLQGPLGAATVVGSGLVYYGLAYWFYLSALRRMPASIAATSFYLVPVFGLAVAFAFGERLDVRAWLGAAVVLVAVSGIGVLSAPGVRGRAVDGQV